MVVMYFFPIPQLQKDFEEDKQQAVTRAMDKLQTELDKVRRQTEDKCREQYKDEMKKLAQKHKETISQTKKKQWVSPSLYARCSQNQPATDNFGADSADLCRLL